jgi:hypothetical protein
VVSTDMFESVLPIPSVCRHSPLLVSQILIVLSCDADASRVESCEKETSWDVTGAFRGSVVGAFVG